jgi:hypothetical protein
MILQEKRTVDFMGYYTLYIPPDTPPPPPNKENLMAALKVAVKNKDAGSARHIFDLAFWNSIELIPDWHNLLVAVSLKDRPMLRLLASHGGGWTEEETRCLKEIFPGQWPEFTATFRGAGIQLPPDNPSQPPDICTLITLMKHLLSSAKDDPREIAFAKSKDEVDDLLSKGVVRSLDQNQTAKARKLLRLRQPEGAVDFSREFKGLLLQHGIPKAVEILDRLRDYKIVVKPMTIDMGIAMYYPEAVSKLDRRNLLAYDQPERMWVIQGWVDQQSYALHCKTAASVLFKDGAPLTEADADCFIRIHKYAIKNHLPAIDSVCDGLKNLGFFDSRVWTKERLRTLAEQAPEGSSLKQEFNKKLAHDRFGKMTAKEILKPENFTPFLEAHRKGYYQASSRQTSDMIVSLHNQNAGGSGLDYIKASLRTLKECGAHFGTVIYLSEGSRFLGKKEPGMAKILLELDILNPGDFSLIGLREKAKLPGGEAELYWTKNTGAYAEFFFQIYLERKYPKEFIPQRGKISSYHEAFKAKIFGQTPPPPSPVKKRGWFW